MTIDLTHRDAKRLLLGLIAIELVLTAIHMAGVTLEFQLGRPIRVFHYADMDEEGNVPAWFSTIQLFIVALVAGLMARRARGDAMAFRPYILVWALGFLFLSMDEMVGIHETVSFVVAREFGGLPHFKGGHGYWIPLYIAVVLGVVLVGARRGFAFYRLFPRESRVITAGILVFLGGAVGLEAVSYYMTDRGQTLLYGLQVGAEEFLEMLGVSLILYGTLLLGAQTLVNAPIEPPDSSQVSR